MCLACKEVLFEEDVDMDAAQYTKDAPYPPLRSPNWSGYPPALHRTAIVAEEIAPDTPAPVALSTIEETINETTAAPASPGSYHIPEWNFPGSPEVRISPPRPGANSPSDLETRHLLRGYYEADGARCWVGGHTSHENWECSDLHEDTEAGRLVQHLCDSKVADDVELGLENGTGWL